MAEVITRDGAWTFDGEVVRIVPGRDRGVHKLRQELGEVAVPLQAVAGAAYEPGRKGGRLRLRLRDGADPLVQAARGQLAEGADPYKLAVGAAGVAEYFVDEVRNSLLIERVPEGPSDRYLVPGPRVPLTATAGDGVATFDGERVRLEWTGWAEDSKKSAGPQVVRLADLAGVEWIPQIGWENGYLRFRVRGASGSPPPKHDPYSVTWGMQKLGGTTVLLAAAVVARLPHPSGAEHPRSALEAAPGTPTASGGGPATPPTSSGEAGGPDAAGDARGDDPDALLRRLRELGELYRDGVLTDEEFAVAKQGLLRRF